MSLDVHIGLWPLAKLGWTNNDLFFNNELISNLRINESHELLKNPFLKPTSPNKSDTTGQMRNPIQLGWVIKDAHKSVINDPTVCKTLNANAL